MVSVFWFVYAYLRKTPGTLDFSKYRFVCDYLNNHDQPTKNAVDLYLLNRKRNDF